MNSPLDSLRRLSLRAGAIGSALLLAACGLGDSEPGPDGVTVGEARALDEAAEMLDEQRLPPPAAGETPAPAGE